MKAPDYRVDLVRDVQPSTASASGVAQAMMNEGAVKAQTTANMIKFAGGQAFEAYKGKQSADFQKKQEALKDEFVTPVVEAGKGLLEAEKLKSEGLVFAAQSADAFAASSILEGQDPDKVYEQAGQIFSKGQAAVLKEYEQKVANYESILSRFPSKQNEMFARSEKLLKEYIAKMPGMADEFRQISARTLGRSGIESFTVTQAIEAVGEFSARQKEAARLAQEQRKEYRDAFKKSYVASGLGTEIEALNVLDSGAEQDVMANIQAASNAQRRMKAIDDSIKVGNVSASVGVAQMVETGTGVLMTGLEPLKWKLQQLGISQREIESGMFSEQSLNNPKVREALNNFAQTSTAGVRSQANQYRKVVADKIANGEWKVDLKGRKEIEDTIKAWETNTIETYIGKEGKGLPDALATYTLTPKDRLDMLNKNLDVYKKLTDVVAQTVPDELRKQLFSSNPAVVKQLTEQYPTLVPIQELFKNLNVAFDDPAVFADTLQRVARSTLPTGTVPANKDQEAANALSVEYQVTAIEKRLRTPGFVPEQSDVALVADLVSKAAATETVGKVFLKKNLGTTKALLDKLTPAQKQDAIEIITNNTNSVLMRHSEFAEQKIKKVQERKGVLSFQDASGASPLRVNEERQKQTPDLSSAVSAATSLYSMGMNIAPITGAAKATDVAELQSALNHIDTALTVRASVTGESLMQLRKAFIKDANQVIQNNGSFNLFNTLPENTTKPSSNSGGSVSPASSPVPGNDILEGLKGLGYKVQ